MEYGEGAAHSAAGSSGSFHQGGNNSSSNSRHRYDDPYYNRDTVYSSPYPRSEEAAAVDRPKCCCLGPAAVLILGTMAVLFGLYSPLQMEAGRSYSRVVSANPLFVREIEFEQSEGASGAYVYEFQERPLLNKHEDLKYDYDRSLDSQRHQEWGVWLNKGSAAKLTYDVPYGQRIIIAVLKGEERFNQWLKDPYDSQSSLFLRRVQGEGKVELTIDEDDDYYFAFGNTGYYPVQLSIRLEARLALYDTRRAFSQCSLQSQNCRVKLPLFQSTFALITTPADSMSHMDFWRFKASYRTRWWTYIIGYGTLLGVISAATLFFKSRSQQATSEEKAPLVAEEDENVSSDIPEHAGVEIPSAGDGSSDDRLCVVCLDAEKDCFFDPCGHCATCYSCGLRVKDSANSICPICRARIAAVRRLFR